VKPSGRVGRLAAMMACSLFFASCGQSGAPPASPTLLGPAAQQAAAAKLARGFAEVCLTTKDALAATHALQAQGWPPFGVVWDQPDSTFYAAKPTPTSPAGLFVISALRSGGTDGLSCVGHYPADGDAPMVAAIEQRWGPSQAGPASLGAGRAWAFRMHDGVLAPIPISMGAGGPATAAALASLRPNEALVYAQVFYNRPYHDVASLTSVRWPSNSK
jgi:hypothetical protein